MIATEVSEVSYVVFGNRGVSMLGEVAGVSVILYIATEVSGARRLTHWTRVDAPPRL